MRSRVLFPFVLVLACGTDPLPDGGPADGGFDTSRIDSSVLDADLFDGRLDTPPTYDGGPVAFERVSVGLDHNQDTPPGECVGAVTRVGCVGSQQTGGAAAADLDEDGFVDLFFPVLDGPDALYRNRGDGTFENVSAAWGIVDDHPSTGAAFADVDGDGDLDLFATTYGGMAHRLYINQGGSFTEEAEERGVALRTTDRPLQGSGVSFGDYDRDGWLDIYVAEWADDADLAMQAPDAAGLRSKSRLLRNLGGEGDPGSFQDVTVAAGIAVENLSADGIYPFGVTFTDLDDDGWLDLALAGDFGTSRLFWNEQDGTFSDGTSAANVGTDSNGMGAAVADVDMDGDLDWLVTSISTDPPFFLERHGNRVYLNEGGRTFREAGQALGIRYTDWSWGVALFDHDHDGDLDSVITNGFFDDARTRFFINDEGAYHEVGEQLMIAPIGQGRSAITLDHDADGDLDVVISRNGDAPLLFDNIVGSDRPWVRVRLEQPGSSNRFAIGARAVARPSAGPPMVRELHAGAQYLGQSESVLHWGLADAARCPLAELEVRWPDGTVQTETDVPCGETTLVQRAD